MCELKEIQTQIPYISTCDDKVMKMLRSSSNLHVDRNKMQGIGDMYKQVEKSIKPPGARKHSSCLAEGGEGDSALSQFPFFPLFEITK